MSQYTPDPMTPAERPAKTAVIWVKWGLLNRFSDDPELMKKLEKEGFPIKPYPGFMEDCNLGTFACLVLDKGGIEKLGPNGWEKFSSGEVMALSVSGEIILSCPCLDTSVFFRHKWKRVLPPIPRTNSLLLDSMFLLDKRLN
jgi:hypothetical protein